MEQTLSGLKHHGEWDEIVEFGEKVEASLSIILQDNRIRKYSEELQDFRDWRPKIDDIEQEKDVHKKTAEQNSVSDPEKKSGEEFSEAKDHLKDATQPKDSDETVSQNLKKSITHATKATQNGVKEQVQNVEEFVYENVMVKMSPTFFDNQLLSASFNKSGDQFVFEVNINDDSLVDDFQKTTESLDETFSRWHIQIEEQVEINNSTEESDIDIVEGEEQETTTEENQFTTLSEVKKEKTRDQFLESQEFKPSEEKDTDSKDKN